MNVIYTTPSKPEADALVVYLADESIDAAVISRLDPYISTHTNFDVIIRTKEDLNLARAVLEEFLATSSTPTEPLEDQVMPDLADLDPSFRPRCPDCDVVLPPIATMEACPSCDAPVNIIDLIVAQHGPEAFAAPPDPVTRHACARCGYPRRGLPDPEICPECGTPFHAGA